MNPGSGERRYRRNGYTASLSRVEAHELGYRGGTVWKILCLEVRGDVHCHDLLHVNDQFLLGYGLLDSLHVTGEGLEASKFCLGRAP